MLEQIRQVTHGNLHINVHSPYINLLGPQIRIMFVFNRTIQFNCRKWSPWLLISLSRVICPTTSLLISLSWHNGWVLSLCPTVIIVVISGGVDWCLHTQWKSYLCIVVGVFPTPPQGSLLCTELWVTTPEYFHYLSVCLHSFTKMLSCRQSCCRFYTAHQECWYLLLCSRPGP